MGQKLNERQKLFGDEYLIDLNATQAAIRAGYSPKYANTNAHKLLQNTAIKEYIAERLKCIADSKVATAQEVMEYLTSVLRGEATDTRVLDEQIYEIKVAHGTRLKAAEMLCKRFGLLQPEADNTENNITIKIQRYDKGDEE